MNRDVLVSQAWLADHRDDVALVDVREHRDYQELGHVPGAVNIPFETFRDPSDVDRGMLPGATAFSELLAAAGIGPDDTVVAYDDDYGVTASRFLLTANVYGHRGDLHLLDGDFTTWSRHHPTETDAPEIAPTEYTVVPPDDPGIVNRDDVEAAIDTDVLLVDTRTPGEYESSHIPSAVQLSWEDLVDEQTHTLKPREALETLLAERGILPHRRIILYCNTARRLSHTYVALSHLGYDNLAFYEGSLIDWLRGTAPDWHPIDIKARVREYADQGFEALVRDFGDDVFNRLKLIGLYHQKQRGYFMLRTKIPGGVLAPGQAEVIGSVADEFARAPDEFGGTGQNLVYGDGFLDITTRQDIQMHWIRLEDVPKIWDRYETVGLTTLQACGNSVRNVVSCPATGLDPDGFLDVRPLVEEVTNYFLGRKEYANLPRKFKISITGCGEDCAEAEINDLGFTPARKGVRLGFNVHAGGGLSDSPRFARDLDLFVEPANVLETVRAAVDVFKKHGNYLDIAVNRLRFLVADMGIDRFREELQNRAAFDFESRGEDLSASRRRDHVGVHDQKGGGCYVGLNVTAGRMSGSEFVEAAGLADRYGTGEIRLTTSQNFLIPHVSRARIDEFLDEPLVDTYSPNPGPFSRGIRTCTGREFCNYGIVETKARAKRWAAYLDEHVVIDDDRLELRLSGCKASCAQPQIADIGLRGETHRSEDGETEAVDIGLGGSLGPDGRFIDWISSSIRIDTIPAFVERLVNDYRENRDPGEQFYEYCRRVPNERHREILTEPAKL